MWIFLSENFESNFEAFCLTPVSNIQSLNKQSFTVFQIYYLTLLPLVNIVWLSWCIIVGYQNIWDIWDISKSKYLLWNKINLFRKLMLCKNSLVNMHLQFFKKWIKKFKFSMNHKKKYFQTLLLKSYLYFL